MPYRWVKSLRVSMKKSFMQIRHLAMSLVWFSFTMSTLHLSNCKLFKSMASRTCFDVVGTLYIRGNLAFVAGEILIFFIKVGFIALATRNGNLIFGSESFSTFCLLIPLCNSPQMLRCSFINLTVIVVYSLRHTKQRNSILNIESIGNLYSNEYIFGQKLLLK